MKIYVVRDREAGNAIDYFPSVEAAEAGLLEYEEADMAEDTYEPDFYEVAVIEINDVKGLRMLAGLTQEAFSARYGIPKRTIEEWEGERRKAPPYVIELLKRAVFEDCLVSDKCLKELAKLKAKGFRVRTCHADIGAVVYILDNDPRHDRLVSWQVTDYMDGDVEVIGC